MIQDNLYRMTGIDVGSKIKLEKPNPDPKLGDVDEECREIRPVRDRKKFEKIQAGVFTSNIKRGPDFLEERYRNNVKSFIM